MHNPFLLISLETLTATAQFIPMEKYINREKVNDTIQYIFQTLSRLSKAEIVGYTAGALTAHYFITTFVLDNLSNIPGPFAAKLTRLYDVKMKATGKRYALIDELHKKYGKIVRTGNKRSCYLLIYSFLSQPLTIRVPI